LATTDARAFCRTRTCEFRDPRTCAFDATTRCSTVGEEVFWSDACISYAIQRDGSDELGITAEQLAPFVAEGFRTWGEVACPGGGTPALAAASQGLIACDAVEYDCEAGARNSNLFVFRDDFDDTVLGLRRGVIALTTLTVNLVTGELFDADIEFNSRDETFSLEPSDPTDPSAGRDLRAVVTHEIGHLLGLSHSANRMALMGELYLARDPIDDDVLGMCAALGSSDTDPACSVEVLPADGACVGDSQTCSVRSPTETEAGCSCRLPGVAGDPRGSVGLGLGLLGLAWLRRRRPRRGSGGFSPEHDQGRSGSTTWPR
jgi:MYXO-CTERM domain-containing protein